MMFSSSVLVLCLLAAQVDSGAPASGAVQVDTAFRAFRAVNVEPARGDVYAGWADPTASFSVVAGAHTIRSTVAAISLAPGEDIVVSLADDSRQIDALLESNAPVVRLQNGSWRLTAPAAPGITAFRVTNQNGRTASDTIVVNLLVHRPLSERVDGVLDGYRIGTYRPRPANRGPEYEPPHGLIPVAASDEDVLVSPDFSLGQFVSKQPGNPKYIAYSRPLVLKLETILAEVRRNGFDAPTLTIMSGFRTPWYNRSIGNRTDFSRHLWGDAADIFVDLDRNGDMDDLNRDGQVNRADAALLARWIDALMERRLPRIRLGGLATYRRNAAHGPFVHVDARGVKARW